MKYVILTSTAVLAIGLSGIPLAQTAPDQAAAAAAAQEQADAATDTAKQYKDMKVDEATAADARFQANRTQANMLARDKAEAEAAAAAGMAEPAGER